MLTTTRVEYLDWRELKQTLEISGDPEHAHFIAGVMQEAVVVPCECELWDIGMNHVAEELRTARYLAQFAVIVAEEGKLGCIRAEGTNDNIARQ